METGRARFDTKLTTQQKHNFEYAASLGGYSSLSAFIITAAEEKAKEIIKEHEAIIASKKDREIFFKAIINAPKPNKKLIDAAKLYKKAINK
jgi:uncharacterized protein (DUF1778 family)